MIRDAIVVDPGLGFGKHPIRHNLPLLAHLGKIVGLGSAPGDWVLAYTLPPEASQAKPQTGR